MDEIDWRKVAILLTLFIVIVGLFGSTFYLYTNYKKIKNLVADPQKLGQVQTKELLARVKALMEIPNEEPTIITILDRTKLQDQPFFKLAQNGDRILIFPKAKRAVLYRPSTNKIVDVTGINLGDTAGIEQSGEVAGSFDLNPTPTVSLPRWIPSPSPTSFPSEELEGFEVEASPTPTEEVTPTVIP
ncbi:hypothetical protein HY612_00950 [Candidatus Roizmanbacteria bacterium]|nr:hypothetical protein [Candidatus Roizmanbacteria bacterium]